MLGDLKFGWRQLRKSPGFSLTAVLTLALGIGGVTAVFSVVEAVLLRPLPYKDSASLFLLRERVEHLMYGDANLSAPDVLTFARENKAFTGVGGFIGASFEASGAGAPFRARAERLTASMFPVLGIEPILGRTFTQQEDDTSAPVTVLSHALWQERYQSDPHVLGKTIELDRRPYTIIGVMPPEFQSPIGLGGLAPRDLWVPMSFTPVEKGAEADNFDYGAVARLKPGVTPQQAQQDVDRVTAIIQAKLPDIKLRTSLRSLKEETVREARPLLRVLLAAVALILLIACANLANLQLVRAAGRRREFGVRLALGAARRTMLRQSLTESLLLSAIGGMLGVALAVVLVHVARASLVDVVPRLNEIAVNWPVVLLAIGLTGVTGVLCGLAPALASMKAEVLDALREGTHGGGQSRGQHRLRNVLVITEAALAMVLLVGAGLLLRSFAKMLATEPGIETTHVMTASLALPKQDYPTQERVECLLWRAAAATGGDAGCRRGGIFIEYSGDRAEFEPVVHASGLCQEAQRGLVAGFELSGCGKLLRRVAYSAYLGTLLRRARRTTRSAAGGDHQPVVCPALFRRTGPRRHAPEGWSELRHPFAADGGSRGGRRCEAQSSGR